jgi:archaellum component FlaC
MSSRTLRSSTAEASREVPELPAGENVISTPSEENVGLGSERDNNQEVNPTHEVSVHPSDNEQSVAGPSVASSNDIEHMLAGFLSALQETIKADISGIKSDINNVRAEITSVKNDINIVKTSVIGDVRAEIANIRKDLNTKNEKLLKSCESTNQELRKELNSDLKNETRRVRGLVRQTKSEFESELIAPKS